MFLFLQFLCAGDWFAVLDSCYLILSIQLTQPIALDRCITNGGQLANVTSDQELAALVDYMATNALADVYTINGHDPNDNTLCKVINLDNIVFDDCGRKRKTLCERT